MCYVYLNDMFVSLLFANLSNSFQLTVKQNVSPLVLVVSVCLFVRQVADSKTTKVQYDDVTMIILLKMSIFMSLIYAYIISVSKVMLKK